MKPVPFLTHVINFLIKLGLFTIIFFTFQRIGLLYFPNSFLYGLPIFFTLIGIVADWVVVPKHHNMVSSLMGATFMGVTTYFIPVFLNIGDVPLLSALFLAILLGIVEATLHRLIVKPYLYTS